VKQVALPQGYDGAVPVELRGNGFHHLARVRRVRPGARLSGRTPDGRLYEMVVHEVGRESVTLVPLGPPRQRAAAAFDMTLLQCVPKGPRLDQIVRQAVEAGVTRIVLVASRRSLARPGDWGDRLSRLGRIASEAMQQSGAKTLPVIEPPVPLDTLRAAPDRLALFLHEKPLGSLEGRRGNVYSPRSVDPAGGSPEDPAAAGLHDYLSEASRVDLLIGPEGGLAVREVEQLLGAGFRPVHLGDTVLRVETAAIFALGAVKTLLLERERWTLRRPQ
jgi:16S rRNA (uracil1498-N3)-methyltransferase